MTESSMPPPSSEPFPEKRTFRRYALWFPVTLMAEGREVWAICRDASAGGFLVSSVMPLDEGTNVLAAFRVDPNGKADRTVKATVVRHTANDGDLVLAFPYRLGLRFDEPVPDLPADLERHERAAAEVKR
jgi:hypothetical protein